MIICVNQTGNFYQKDMWYILSMKSMCMCIFNLSGIYMSYIYICYISIYILVDIRIIYKSDYGVYVLW